MTKTSLSKLASVFAAGAFLKSSAIWQATFAVRLDEVSRGMGDGWKLDPGDALENVARQERLAAELETLEFKARLMQDGLESIIAMKIQLGIESVAEEETRAEVIKFIETKSPHAWE